MKAKKARNRKQTATAKELWLAINGLKKLSNESIADVLGTTRQSLTNWSKEDK